MKTPVLRSPLRLALLVGYWLGVSITAAAQTGVATALPASAAPPASALVPVPTATGAPAAAQAASAPATVMLAPAQPAETATPAMPTAVAPAPGDCRGVSDKAMAMDLAAVTAQSKKADLNEQARLFKEAVALWSQVAEQCEGRAKERAVRNRADDQQTLDRIAEKLDSGPQCTSAHKDAAALQDIGKQALSERRWADASSLFRKAENMWDFAAERCSGSQQEVANRHREQSAQDGHNAQYCAPLFEKAREHTQKLRSAAAGMSREDKQDASMVAETLWRDALDKCKGAAVQDIATNNAKALARERGTPWVPRVAPAAQEAAAAVSPAASPAAAVAGPAVAAPGVAKASLASLAPASAPLLAQTVSLEAGATPAAAQNLPEAAKAAEPVAQVPGTLLAGTTRFTGQFARDADATTISGTGKVTWATGDVFEGTLVKGQRHGTGAIVWANGQRYAGDWVQDKPTGQAKMHFANGNDYEGQVVDGTPQGAGHMRYASGDEFEGQFHNGEPHQRGVYVWRNGQRYDGAWVNGRATGQGKLTFATGNQFEGLVVNGVPQGAGRMTYAGGEVYVGQFRDGEPNGEGVFTWPSGDKYDGQWSAGKKHGKGVFSWKSGDRWEGVYDNDVQKN